MATAYMRHEPLEMGVQKMKGVVYLDVHKLPERPQSELGRRRYVKYFYFIYPTGIPPLVQVLLYSDYCLFDDICYWGYCIETLATEDPTRADGGGIHHVDADVEYCVVIKTKLGAHRILMVAEMDCCDSHDDGRRFYIELKTSRELDYHTEERIERKKMLKFWKKQLGREPDYFELMHKTYLKKYGSRYCVAQATTTSMKQFEERFGR